MSDETNDETSGTAEIRYLQPDGVGVSPLTEYPGTIAFPLIMTLPMHKRWQAFVNNRSESDSDSPRIGVAFNADVDENERVVFVYDDVELGLMFGRLELTGPDGKRFNPKASDDLPLPLAVWIAKCYREWENSQVRFRWNGAAGLAAPDVQ